MRTLTSVWTVKANRRHICIWNIRCDCITWSFFGYYTFYLIARLYNVNYDITSKLIFFCFYQSYLLMADWRSNFGRELKIILATQSIIFIDNCFTLYSSLLTEKSSTLFVVENRTETYIILLYIWAVQEVHPCSRPICNVLGLSSAQCKSSIRQITKSVC